MSSGGSKLELFRPGVQLGIFWSHQEDPAVMLRVQLRSAVKLLEWVALRFLEVMLCGGGSCSFCVTLLSVTLLPKELFVFGRQPEKEIEQSLNQSKDESLEEIVKEVETELEQEEIHLFQAEEEKIQQFQEEMRQEEEEAEKLNQQKEKPLR